MTQTGLDEQQLEFMQKDQCIIVNELDVEVGPAPKEFCHLVSNIVNPDIPTLHRAFSVFLFNEKGELLLQQRAAEKITFPLYWTNTCCSHPLYNEEYNEREMENQNGIRRAAHRKLEHELGIPKSQIDVNKFQYMTRIMYVSASDKTWGEHEVDYCLLYQFKNPNEITMDINKNEIEETLYVTKQQLIDMMQDPNLKFTPWFKLIVERFLYQWWDALLAGQDLEQFKDPETVHNLL